VPTKHTNKVQAISVKLFYKYSGLNLNQDKATKPQTVQIVRQGKARQRRSGLKLIHYTIRLHGSAASKSLPTKEIL